MAEYQCTNIERNENGEYEDIISSEVIPPERLVHFTRGNATFCYDSLTLYQYIVNEQRNRRQARLPDNFTLLTPAGVQEVLRIARASFPQVYQVTSNGEMLSSFSTEAKAQAYINKRPAGRQYQIIARADTDDPDLDDLLYPNGYEATLFEPIAGEYFDEGAMRRRSAENRRVDAEDRQREAEQQAREAERLAREGPEAEAARIAEVVRQEEERIRQRYPQAAAAEPVRVEGPMFGRPGGGFRAGNQVQEENLVQRNRWANPFQEDPEARQRAIEAYVAQIQQRFNNEVQQGFEQADQERRAAEAEREAAFRRPREGEIELGEYLAKEVRPGGWRCSEKENVYRSREYRDRYPDDPQRGEHFEEYCSPEVLEELRARGRRMEAEVGQGWDVEDPRDYGIDQEYEVDGERILLAGGAGGGYPNCQNDGTRNLSDMCRSDLIQRLAAESPKRFLHIDDGIEYEYRYDPDADHFYCRNMDVEGAEEEECDDRIYNSITWQDEKPIDYRRQTLRGPIECATREEVRAAVRNREPVPWRECTEEQKVILRDPADEYGHFRRMEAGQYADEQDAADLE